MTLSPMKMRKTPAVMALPVVTATMSDPTVQRVAKADRTIDGLKK